METLKQQLNIPANHRVKLNIKLPEEIPAGEAELIMIIAPRSAPRDNRRDIMELAGSLRHSRAFRGNPLSIQKRWRDEW